MTRIAILGLGPAAIATAIRLQELGHNPTLIGMPRRDAAWEGVSERVAEALRRLGCAPGPDFLTPFERVSCWNARRVALNREAVVDRVTFDAALLAAIRPRAPEIRIGRIRRITDLGTGWRIESEGADGPQVHTADFLVEARGAAAPRRAADRAAAPPALALVRDFAAPTRSRSASAETITESFRDGWAWCVVRADGRASVQIVVDAEAGARPAGARLAPDATHALGMKALVEIPARLGSNRQAAGGVHARAVRPGLRAAIAGRRHLRVGDAAASHDPLSGHGLFEAIGSAFAAAPTINTLVRAGADADAALALTYYRERCRLRFLHNLEVGAGLYRSETRWPDAPFWRKRSTAPAAALTPPGWAVRPVVEDGRIVAREVAVTPDHPLGVRFLDGVDLAALRRGEADAPPPALAAARRWLDRYGLLADGAR